MTLEDLGNVGELIGAIGVVVSLIYLAIQIRQNTIQLKQNTDATESTAYHQAVEQSWSAMLAAAANPDLADIVNRGSADLANLSADEFGRFDSVVSLHFYCFDNLLRSYEKGQIDRETWENVFLNSIGWFSQPGVLAYGRTRRGPLSHRLVNLIEKEAERGRDTGAA